MTTRSASPCLVSGGGRDGGAGPFHRPAGVGVEVGDVELAHRGGVVVPAHALRIDRRQARHDGVRVGAVATTSPRCHTASTSPAASSTASSAVRFAWMSERTATRMVAEGIAAAPAQASGRSGPLSRGAFARARAFPVRRRSREPVRRRGALADDHQAVASSPGTTPAGPPAGRHRAGRRSRAPRRARRPAARASRRPAARRARPAASRAPRAPASAATARATTTGHRSRSRGSAARVSARSAATATRVAQAGAPPRWCAGTPPSCRSTRRGARPAGSAAASGRPGKPPPTRGPATAARRDAEAAARRRGCRATWSVAAATGSRMAVRLMAWFHASNSRTCPSMTSRAPAGRSIPSVARPARARRRTPREGDRCPGRASGAVLAGVPTAPLLWSCR